MTICDLCDEVIDGPVAPVAITLSGVTMYAHPGCVDDLHGRIRRRRILTKAAWVAAQQRERAAEAASTYIPLGPAPRYRVVRANGRWWLWHATPVAGGVGWEWTVLHEIDEVIGFDGREC